MMGGLVVGRQAGLGTVSLCLMMALSGCAPTALAPTVVPTPPTAINASPAPASASPSAPASTSPVPASASPSAAASPSASAAELTKLSVVYSAVSPSYLALWAAKDLGIFQENGLDVDLQLTSGGSPAMAVFLSGQVDVFQASGSDVMSAEAGGADVVVTATTSAVYPFKVEVPASVTSPAELKGKTIGISSVGDASDVALHLALAKIGLDPDKDVTAVAVGSTQNAVTAMLAGGLDAALLSPPNDLTVEAAGFHSLFDIPSLNLPVANQEVAGQRGWLASQRDVMQKYVDSIIIATARVRRDRATALDLLRQHLGSNDEEALGASYDFTAQEVLAPLPFPRAEQFSNVLSIIGQQNEKLAGLDVDRLIDPSFVQSAADRGLDKAP